jgi:threonine/homoserine/homoserine lactone efflux protein
MIDLPLILALATYYFAMFITPGPNNTMLTISGIKFGFKRTVPHIFGISTGHAIQISIVCLGLGSLFQKFPHIQEYLKWACLIYLLYLAWSMIGSIKIDNVESGRPLRFYEASLFQWVNPKAWTIATIASTAFFPNDENIIIAIIFISLTAFIINLPCISLWALFGASIKKFINNQLLKKMIEYIFAILLVLTGIYLIL